ncbi:MAG: hypothetical protein KAJ19_13605 [Gammaproteobacteria bacterium]|nr:hypothetical protein [Gammaproteobacteria bacterium]
MIGFLIPLAGMALGALGRLAAQRRSARAQGQASAAATAPKPSETGMATAAMSPAGTSQTASAGQSSRQPIVLQTKEKTGGGLTSEGPRATQPATGPVQQNQGLATPTPTIGDNAGLAARLGAESKKRSAKKNREQQAALSNQALS